MYKGILIKVGINVLTLLLTLAILFVLMKFFKKPCSCSAKTETPAATDKVDFQF